MRNYIVGIALALTLTLSGCAADVTAGTVVNKEFTEAYTTEEEITEQECEKERRTTGVGKNKKTSYVNECEDVATGEFETVEHEATYVLTLEDKEQNTGEVSVSEAEFNSVEEGDFFDAEAN